MNKAMKFIATLILLGILFVPGQLAHAQEEAQSLSKGLLDGEVIFGDDYTLESGQTLDGDLVVFGGNVTLEDGSVVRGSVVVFGGTISQSGEVEKDVVIFGGQIDLDEAARVGGNVVTIGGQVNRAPGAVVEGDVVENIPAPRIDIPNPPNPPSPPDAPNVPDVPNRPDFDLRFNPFWEAMNVVIRAVAVAALAMLLGIFLQPQLERVGQAIVEQPLVSGSLGLLTLVLTPFVLLIMIVTILLIPVAVISVLLLMLAWLFGIVAIGQEVGERFTKAINQTWAPVLSIGFGTFLLVFVGGFIGLVPCIGWLVPMLIGFVAIGGVVMTWFGSRNVTRPAAITPVETVPPAA